MDAGLAAIIGGTVGVVGGGMTTWAAGRASLRQALLGADTDHAQWLRQQRQEAYVAVLATTQGLEDALVRAAEAIQRGDGSDVEARRGVETARNEWRQAGRRVGILGPDAAITGAREISEQLNQLEIVYRTVGPDLPVNLPPAVHSVQNAVDRFGANTRAIITAPPEDDRQRKWQWFGWFRGSQ